MFASLKLWWYSRRLRFRARRLLAAARSLPRIQPAVGGLTVFSGIKVWWYSKLLQSSDGNVCRIAAESLGRFAIHAQPGP